MNEAYAMIHKPKLLERVWRRLGFRASRVDLPDGIEVTHPGWMMTETRMQFSVGDRFRLLLTGKLHLTTRQATTQQVDEAVNATSHRILYPGETW